MIHSITISALGVIEATDVEFGPGLTVLTGETGAGKTMVLTSVNLLLGRRADPGLVRAGHNAATVDGIFSLTPALAKRAEELGAQTDDDEIIVSRTVAAQGRSRAHLGGRPVPAAVLAELADQLVTIHGQADQLELRGTSAQRETLDAHGGAPHASLLAAYNEAWARAVAAKRAFDEALNSHEDRSAEIESLRGAITAIAELNVQAGEEDELRAETERLTNIEDLRQYIGKSHAMLTAGESSSTALDLARQSLEELRHATRFDPSLDTFYERLNSLCLELDAFADDLGHYLRGLEADPVRLAALHDRRAALRELLRGRASDTAELLDWYEKAQQRLDLLENSRQTPEECQRILEEAKEEVLRIGAELTAARQRHATSLSEAVTTELRALAMPNARFIIELTPRKPSPHGCEDVTFLLQAHPSMQARPLGQGASGGELSRIMLALEVVLGQGSTSPTYIFDEVDAGIGGRTATEVGRRLAKLARHKQVIVVTHLPQVAAFAAQHLVVNKEGASTTVHAVNGNERVDELARMMGADEGSDVARRHAQELLESASMEES
ncbi:DNA repair protein RecN [Schaalia canis]|uniref:DNA repair protein RecN n=1 Tax=Schaalia canis TaxID=100469 RepID=A0A3P1SIH0_9ACTO|nr:DNA repair protein RecN [Schaalia canis]RRC96112.1 DNA repair protein RecN [Schaalia canis]